MLTKILKITTGGLVILGGCVFAYRYGHARGLLDEEGYKERKKRGLKPYYHQYGIQGCSGRYPWGSGDDEDEEGENTDE